MKRALWATVAVVLILGIAELILPLFGVPAYVVPRPSRIWRAIASESGTFTRALLWTAGEALAGLAFAATFAAVYGFIMIYRHSIADAMSPVMLILQSTPILAIAPLLVTWFGPGVGSKVASSFIVCFFPLAIGVATGLRDVDEQEHDLFSSLGVTEWQRFRHLRLYRALPWLFSALRYAGPLSVVGAIVGEFVGANRGLGFEILSSSYYLRMDRMFAGVALSTSLSLSLFGAAIALERRFYFWRNRG